MNEFPNIPPWNGEQSKDFSVAPWYFPSQEYNKNYINEIREALDNNKPYSWIRIGDGEIVILQQEYVHSIEYLRKNVGWSNGTAYCGAKLPNIELRDRMINGLKNANLVGVFKGDPPTEEVLKAIGIQPKSICYAFDNIALPMNPDFVRILLDYPILLVGKDSKWYAEKFKEVLDVDVVGIVSISDYSEIDRCMEEMMKYDYKLALVSAGANAKAICPEMAQKKNAVFLDMGHAWDNAFHPKGRFDEYWLIPVWKSNKVFVPTELVLYNKVLYRLNTTANYSSEISPDKDNNWYLF
jgi:hypothetical protein